MRLSTVFSDKADFWDPPHLVHQLYQSQQYNQRKPRLQLLDKLYKKCYLRNKVLFKKKIQMLTQSPHSFNNCEGLRYPQQIDY